MKVTKYNCTGIIQATDAANLYYINSNRAAYLEKDTKGKQINVQDWKKQTIAIFAY